MSDPMRDDWDTAESAERVVTWDDGKAHAFVGVCRHEGGTCHCCDEDIGQFVEVDARQGPVTLAFTRRPTREEAATVQTGADYSFALGVGDRIHVRPIVEAVDPAAAARAAKIEAVLADPQTRAELVDRLQLEAVDAQLAALKANG